MAFDIRDVLGTVSKSDPGQEQIVYIALDKLDGDPSNFYTLEGIEELADNISLIGLQQPLRIRPGKDGHFIVVSGHRRRAACLLISHGATENAHMFDKGVPCIIDNDECSPAMRELRLIYANSSTRVMTPAEVSKQAERIEAILYQLSEEGVEFKGRMRDHVAKACAVSRSKIARLHAIRNNLVPDLLKEFDAGNLNESVAYRMSQEHRLVQQDLYERAGALALRGYDINATERAITQLKESPRPSPSAASNEFQEKWEADRQRIRDILEREDDDFFEMLVDVKGMFLKDLFALNTRKEGIERLKEKHGKTHHGGGGGVIWDFTCKPTGLTLQRKENTDPITRSWTEVYDLLCTIALNDAADDAMKRRKPVSEPDKATPAWNRDPEPPKEGRYLCLVDMNTRTLHEQRCDWRGGMWYAFGMPLQDLFTVVAWWPLPEEAPHPEWWSGMDDDEEEEGEE